MTNKELLEKLLTEEKITPGTFRHIKNERDAKKFLLEFGLIDCPKEKQEEVYLEINLDTDCPNYDKIIAKVKLAEMPFDKRIETPRGSQLCHATGIDVKFEGDYRWWHEYVDQDGNLYYGR